MTNSNVLLRAIPKVDVLCAHPLLKGQEGTALTNAARNVLENLRQAIIAGKAEEIPQIEELCGQVEARLKTNERHSLRRVINGTGVVLHTNLGRACLSQRAVAAVTEAAGSYSTLEYNLQEGVRGSRHSHVEDIICRLTGAEAAMVVNNNAAAVLLVLAALTAGREVVISRGELVEIGGSFRIPEVMGQGGAILHEVGTTNKTHLYDYENAINENTGALLKVHTSNYRIVGFTESVSLAQLAKLGKAHSIPVIEDLGSGLLLPPELFGITDEPYVPASVEAGADVITFSGDKLLGGPQAGIIIGKKAYIEGIKGHQLARALRIDKLTLAALEATLRCYLNREEALAEIPVLAMLTATQEQLKAKAERLFKELESLSIKAEVVPDEGQVGGGSVPHKMLPSFAVAIKPVGISLEELEKRMRLGETPVIGHISKDRYLLNALTLFEGEIFETASAIASALAVEVKE